MTDVRPALLDWLTQARTMGFLGPAEIMTHVDHAERFVAAIGPDFKAGYADPAPISNADIAPTLARIGGIDLAPKGKLTGRVIGEALKGGKAVAVTRRTVTSDPGPGGVRTILNEQTRYSNTNNQFMNAIQIMGGRLLKFSAQLDF